MAHYFLDTSALAKHYHVEVGTAEVEQLLARAGARHFISRLSVIEVQSVFASKARAGVIMESDFHLLRRRFLTDVAKRQLNVVRMTGLHYQEAERRITTHALTHSLRTLDALQLSVALDLHQREGVDRFVCADRNLCAAARLAGLAVTNPEEPKMEPGS